jgi:hypothetical protein
VFQAQEMFKKFSEVKESLGLHLKYEENQRFSQNKDKLANDIFFKNRFTLCFDIIGVLVQEIPCKTKVELQELDNLLSRKAKDIVLLPKQHSGVINIKSSKKQKVA